MKKISLTIILILLLIIAGCGGDGAPPDAITGELVAICTYHTIYESSPPDYIPMSRTILASYSPAIELDNGDLLLLFSPGTVTHYEYDQGVMVGATTTIAGYTYTDNTPFTDERRVMSGQTRCISHTDKRVAITGDVESVTGYMTEKIIHVETVKELT